MDNSATASAQGAGSPKNARPKRSRTGCMTCRNRRRDEGKPVCQNCILKGFECEYAAPFQILGRHNFTPRATTAVQYASVRFAGDHSEEWVRQEAVQSAQTTGDPSSDPPSRIHAVKPSIGQTGATFAAAEPRLGSNHTSSRNRYEFALHGLLALSSNSIIDHGENVAPGSAASEDQDISNFDFARSPSVAPGSDEGVFRSQPEMRRVESGLRPTPGFVTVSPDAPGPQPTFQNPESHQFFHRHHHLSDQNVTIPLASLSRNTVTAHQRLELLKFYRYNIAPWLDICDAHQHFGVELLAKSKRITGLRSRIIQMAATSSSMSWSMESSNLDSSSLWKIPNGGTESNAMVEAIVGVLDDLIDMMPNLAAWWARRDTEGIQSHILERLLLELGSSELHTCAYWLSVRLELSRALVGGNCRISLPHLNGQQGRYEVADSVAQCAYDAIALCVDSVMFAQGDDDRWLQHRYGLNRVEIWNTLVRGFAYWYTHRTQAFQPIIELYPKDGVQTDDDFPTIVFTSGAALLANQLYHTGMLLLLQNKPRFTDRPCPNSPSMSTLWHVHRICGIAIQNDRSGWWDPSLVASLVTAGRTATHESQHETIVFTLQSVQRLTGWKLGAYVDQLKSEWQLAAT